jgi:flagellar hook protein FlgE
MFAGVSGLRTHQTMMDVIGNNIANVNTVGYKASSAEFTDVLSQMISGAGLPTATLGGTNPAQIGLGVRLAGISTDFTQGAAQLTGRATDLSIQGDGFFVVRSDNQQLYTRAGSLSFDALGRLTTTDGSILQGWPADSSGAINTNTAVQDLTMPLGQTIPPQVTATTQVGGNLDASAAVGTAITSAITVYDQQGAPVNLALTFTKSAADQWTISATGTDPAGNPITVTPSGNPMTFNPATGALSNGPFSVSLAWAGFAAPITLDFGTPGAPGAITQFSGTNSIAATAQDGYGMGTLQAFTIGNDGVVTGVFSNGRNRPIGQIALASFSNPGGLEKVGGSLYRTSVNSGLAQIGVSGTAGRGSLSGSTLEMSNVDLAREFTELIIAQRGFQANSRVITASDELLQDLVNLKR